MTHRIFAPNVYLYAYHLQQKSQPKGKNPFWQNCETLLHQFTSEELTTHLDFSQPRFLLTSENQDIPFNLTDYPEIEGYLQLLQFDDSYGVFFNVGYDEKDEEDETIGNVEIDILQQFNPNHKLQFPFTESFLGETILLTLWLTRTTQQRQMDYLKELANSCYQKLFKTSTIPLAHSGELFGSSIFEYGNPRKPDESPHVLIWLFRDELADQTLQRCSNSLIDLFFFRHKVVRAFYDSREIYKKLKQDYSNLDPTLDTIQTQLDNASPNPLDNTNLRSFKTQLKQLSSDFLAYDRLLRKMKDFYTTILINSNNYNDKIEEICAILELDKEELSFWRHFGEQTAPQFQSQIAADLSYFEQGTELIQACIDSIRGIVEIDQAECERQWQRWEKERDRRYQDDLKKQEQSFLNALHAQNREFQQQLEAERQANEASEKESDRKLETLIYIISAGLGGAGIAASSSGYLTAGSQNEEITIRWIPDIHSSFHPFTVVIFISLSIGLVFGGFAWLIRRVFFPNKSPEGDRAQPRKNN